MKTRFLISVVAVVFMTGCTKKLEEENAALRVTVAVQATQISQLKLQLAETSKRVAEQAEQISRSRPPPQFEISGEVFIATKGGTNYKLGSVAVQVFTRAAIEEVVRQTRVYQSEALAKIDPLEDRAEKDLQKAQEIYFATLHAETDAHEVDQIVAASKKRAAAEEDYQRKEKVWHDYLQLKEAALSMGNYFGNLPSAFKTTRTNSDGRFRLGLDRKQDYVLVVQAERSIGDTTENYYWFVGVPKPQGEQTEISLTNANLSTIKTPIVD